MLMLALLLGSIAPGVGTLLVASPVIGLAATLAQDIVQRLPPWRPRRAAREGRGDGR